MSIDWPVVRGTGERSMSVMMGCIFMPGWRASINANEAPATPAPDMRTESGLSDMAASASLASRGVSYLRK
jgi:hypothetical protein